MKKALSIILIIAMLLGFSACGKKPANEDNDPVVGFGSIFDEAVDAALNAEKKYAEPSSSNLLAPAQDYSTKLYGYINTAGEWVIQPAYSTGTQFSEGCAAILDEYNEYCIIDKLGNTQIRLYSRATLIERAFYSEGLIPVKLSVGYDQCYAYLDKYVAAPFTAVNFPTANSRLIKNRNYFALATPFVNGLALVMKVKNAALGASSNPETAFIVNKAGEIVAQLPAGLDPDEFGFDDQRNVIVHNNQNLYGLCDSDGNLLIECKYRKLQHCEGPLYLACNESGFWGYINSKDETVINFKYQKAMPFSEGIAAVSDGSFWGFVNENGDVVMDFIFDRVEPQKIASDGMNLSKGAACGGCCVVLRNNIWSLIDTEGNVIAASDDAQLFASSLPAFKCCENGLVAYAESVGGDVLYGLMTKNAEIIFEPVFTDIGLFR